MVRTAAPQPAPPTVGPQLLDRRTLNRALLSRQHLLERTTDPALVVIHHLVGLQAQSPNPPYVGLWARIAGFTPPQLSDLITGRQVGRVAAMRSTIHLLTADDAVNLRPQLASVLHKGFRTAFGRQLKGHDPAAVAERGRALCAEQPLTVAELGALLLPDFPGAEPQALAMAVRTGVPLIQVPPRGLWGQSGLPRLQPADTWFGRPEALQSPWAAQVRWTTDSPEATQRPDAPEGPVAIQSPDARQSPDAADGSRADGSDVAGLVLRYLGAFGPASAADVTAWSGITGVAAILAGMRDELAVFVNDRGRELFDLPDAPRPPADTPAPVRLLPEWDNVLLSHADRTRILADEHKAAVFTVNGIVLGTVLVDGFVQATWRLRRTTRDAIVEVTTLGRTTVKVRRQIEREALALLAFAAPQATGQVSFAE